MKINVQYSTMIVTNLNESVSFYGDVLGFSKEYYVKIPNGQIQIMKSPEGACVELIESADFPTGLYSVGTDVDNLDEVIEMLKGKGYETGPVAKTTVGRQAMVCDPDGVRIVLIEHTDEYRERYMK